MGNQTAVVVVTYNRKVLLEENIQALLNQTCKDLDIYIIDNASTDGTVDMVKAYQETNANIIYINTGANLGGAGGFAFGLNEVYKRDYKYCWIMDDDTIPNADAYESLKNKATYLNDDFSFICSYVKWTDGELCKMNTPGVKKALFSKFNLLSEHLLFVKTCSFVSAFVNVEIGKQAGLPIKEFFIYGDDYEYTLRLSGIKPGYWDLDSIVVHKMGANIGINIATESDERLGRHFYNVRNLTYVAKKYKMDGIPVCIINSFGSSLNIIKNAKSMKFKRLGITWKGFFAGLFFNPQIIREYK